MHFGPRRFSLWVHLVRALVDPQGRGRQYIVARLGQLAGTRAVRPDARGGGRKMGCRNVFFGSHVRKA
jgi:hypothetical protein